MAPGEIAVRGKYSNLSGCYSQVNTDARGFPVYKRKANGVFLFRSSSGGWVLGDEWDDSRYFMKAASDAKEPTGIVPAAWSEPGSLRVVAVTRPDTAAAPAEVYVQSEYGNIHGNYTREPADFDYYPAYRNTASKVYFFHSRVAGSWCFGSELSEDRVMGTCESDVTDVTALGPSSVWSEAGLVQLVKKLEKPKFTAAVPAEVGIRSQYANIRGNYRRLPENVDHYPAYQREDKGTYLYHLRGDGCWRFCTEVSHTKYMDRGRSDTVDVTQLRPQGWGDSSIFTAIVALNRPSTAGVPPEIGVVSECANVRGTFGRLPEDFDHYPAYKHRESAMLLYHIRAEGSWYMSEERGRPSSNKCASDEVDPSKLKGDAWQPADLLSKIVRLQTNINTSRAPREVIVQSRFPYVAGRYVRRAEDADRFPSYYCAGTKLFLHHTRAAGEWALADKVGRGSYGKCSGPGEVDVTRLERTQWTKAWVDKEKGVMDYLVTRIFVPPQAIDTSSAPQEIVLESRYDNLSHTYRRIADFDRYPAYHCDDPKVNKYLFHSMKYGAWRICDELDEEGRRYSECRSDKIDVRSVTKEEWADSDVLRIFGTEELANRTHVMYHGTSMKVAKLIQKEGFKPSASGHLGPGVYFVDRYHVDKAKRFAHDMFHRFKKTSLVGGGQADERTPALIRCEVSVGRVLIGHGSHQDGKWATEGYDAIWVSKTDVSSAAEWCVCDASKIRILDVTDLTGEGCPWGEHCPYEKKTRMPGTPWGGLCAFRSK